MTKRGQESFSMSFGSIFSIFIIAVIVAIAFYAISHFLNLNKCAQVGLFYNDLQKEIDKAWTSSIYKDNFVGNLPQSGALRSGIKEVCFGNLNSASVTEQEKFSGFTSLKNANIFVFPPENACNGKSFSRVLKNAEIRGFFCIALENGKIIVKLEKSPTEELVKLSKP
ncbi:hypothetical protein HYV50_01925 [Candidatus Pacearchaeota archaeon]|nr:hypothetical protein [Candidatus Pacearchaeota archaeon]